MRVDDIRTMYAYNQWANGRILDQAARLTPEQYAGAALGACSLRKALEHTLGAEVIWRWRWQGLPIERDKLPHELPDGAALRAKWDLENSAMLNYLDTLDDDAIHQPLTYHGRGDEVLTRTLWHLLVHVVNHGTQHRSEVALLLTELGLSPGDLDFSLFAREKGL